MKIREKDIIKAYRKASREIELENRSGFVSRHKIHRSLKYYTRKIKHKNSQNFDL